MKSKKEFSKKLTINKVTVANLNAHEMNHARGGGVKPIVNMHSRRSICQQCTNSEFCADGPQG